MTLVTPSQVLGYAYQYVIDTNPEALQTIDSDAMQSVQGLGNFIVTAFKDMACSRNTGSQSNPARGQNNIKGFAFNKNDLTGCNTPRIVVIQPNTQNAVQTFSINFINLQVPDCEGYTHLEMSDTKEGGILYHVDQSSIPKPAYFD
jgi:hypothetical protein